MQIDERTKKREKKEMDIKEKALPETSLNSLKSSVSHTF